MNPNLEQLALEVPDSAEFGPEDRRDLRRIGSALRFLRRRSLHFGERPPSILRFARAIERLVSFYGRAESPLEREVAAVLIEFGLSGHFEPQRRVPIQVAQPDGTLRAIVCRPDFVSTSQRFAVFVDGAEVHDHLHIAERDAAINLALTVAGWRVLRVRASTIRERPALLVSMIQQGLSSSAAA